MSNLINRIITISGEPASGKSTVINKLKEEYEKKGFKVHITAIGSEFRKIAQERGLSIKEFNEYMKKRSGIDEYIDSKVAEEGKRISEQKRPNDIYIFDSRLAWHNIPNSMSVRLTVDSNVAGKRVFKDKKRGKEDRYSTLEEAVNDTENRKKSEVERYKKRYGIDLQNPDNYNLVIDTSYSNVEDITEVIEKCLELEMKGQFYSKKWTTPKKLLPMQYEVDTLKHGSYYTLEEMENIIKNEGYKPSEEIDVIEVDKKLYILEGHHRNFAAGRIGKTLVPYYTVAKDDEEVTGYSRDTAKKRAFLDKKILNGHEWLFEINGEKFSYNDIYPGIYEEIEKREADVKQKQTQGEER